MIALITSSTVPSPNVDHQFVSQIDLTLHMRKLRGAIYKVSCDLRWPTREKHTIQLKLF